MIKFQTIMLSWIKNRKKNSDQNQNTEEDKNIDQGEKNQINDEESKLFFLTEKKLDYSKKTSDECTDCKKKKNNELEETKICICDCCNVNRIQNYSDYFNFAIESNEVKNLAILGEYGVGKSSIFKSFLYNFDKQKYKNSFIEIEVGQYHKNNINKDDKDFNETKYVQKQILIQIATQVKSKKIKSSNYNLSLFNLKWWQIFLFAILVLVTIIFSTFFSISLTDYIKNANKITQALVKTNEAQLEHSWTQGWSLTTIIIFGIISIFLIGIIFVLIRRYLNKIKFTFSFFSQKIEMEFYKQGIFQETDIRISEILDIFKTLWKKEGKFIYVFEDIDRFGNTFILQKLKELNKNINNFLKNNKPWIDELEDGCPRIKKILKQFEKWIKYFQICTRKSNYDYPNKIIFVYLVTPELFNLDEKVKFFDLAIPIVPITSKGKASEFWFQNFENVISKLLKLSKEEVNNKYKKNVDWHKYFLAISETVYDIRSILNILNEFTIYFKLFYSNVESKNMEILIFRLLSFIIFKNVFYNEYISIWNLKLKDLRRIQNDNNER
ncbi:YobI family P-loop NTPase [Mesomycoplasma bovoculi]|nr:hypothetical protein [Mesomycoplasma bovoculi]